MKESRLRELSETEFQERTDVITFLEFGIGSEDKVHPGVNSVVNFLDGMKFALGMIRAAQIRSDSLSWIIGAEVPMARLFHPEIFEDSKE